MPKMVHAKWCLWLVLLGVGDKMKPFMEYLGQRGAGNGGMEVGGGTSIPTFSGVAWLYDPCGDEFLGDLKVGNVGI